MIWILKLGYSATYFRLTPLTFHSFINATAFRWNLWAQGGILNLYNRDMACIKIYQNITISCSKTILARLDPTNAATWFASPIQLEGSPPHSIDFVKHGTAGRTDLHWTRGQKWSETNRGFASQRFSCTIDFSRNLIRSWCNQPLLAVLGCFQRCHDCCPHLILPGRNGKCILIKKLMKYDGTCWSGRKRADVFRCIPSCKEDTRGYKMIQDDTCYHFV